MQRDSAKAGARSKTFVTFHVALLGGFRVERAGTSIPDFAWQRRSAKRLTKLLAARRIQMT